MSIVKENGKYKNLKLSDIPLNGSVIVEKIFDKTFEGNGQFGTFYTTKIKCEGQEDVGILFSEKQNKEWELMPRGEVKITKTVEEMEFTIKGNKVKKPVNKYVFEAVGGNSSPSPSISISTKPNDTLTEMEQEILDMAKASGRSDVFEVLITTLQKYKSQFPDKIGDISAERIRGWL